jgi:SAM-dependent methyltransferase
VDRPPQEDYRQIVREVILDESRFIRATFSGPRRSQAVPWVRVTVRPLLIKDRRHLQFSCFEPDKDITRNYAGAACVEQLDRLLALPFRDIHLRTTCEDIHVRVSKKGRAAIRRSPVAGQPRTPDLSHDRQKRLLLPDHRPDPFLQAIGVMAEDGQVRAGMQDKFRQVNEFLRLLTRTGGFEELTSSPLHIVDCGCGSAALTFAVYHYLNHILGRPARLTGIDVRADLLEKQAETARTLGWPDLAFQTTRILDFQPERPPDIVLALHACDTATDEALAQGVRWGSRMIFSAPCCHHHLQAQLGQAPIPSPFRPVLRHGILSERLGDLLTDALRAQALRVMGYRADVVEFVSTEHTAKNLLIRAVKTTSPGDPRSVEEYRSLRAFWQVTPHLERLLGEAFPAEPSCEEIQP